MQGFEAPDVIAYYLDTLFDESDAGLFLDALDEINPGISDAVQGKCASFERHISMMSDRGIQDLLRRIPLSTISSACCDSPQEIIDCIRMNLSRRSGDVFISDIEAMRGSSPDSISHSKKIVMKEILQMLSSGDLVIDPEWASRRGLA